MFEQRTALHRRIGKFREIQVLYMPIVCQKLAADPSSTTAPQHVEATPLFLPSSLSSSDRHAGCKLGLADAELRLRKAQCQDALEELRTMIHIRTRLVQYKRYEVRHVGPNTRCNELIKNHENRIHRMANKYRRARKAIMSLLGPGEWEEELKELKAEDLRGLEDDDVVTEERKREQRRKRRKKNNLPTPAEGSRVQSWIWSGVSEGNSQYSESEYRIPLGLLLALTFMAGLRLEWIKAHARTSRWDEELQLLSEEIRRVGTYFDFKADEWEDRSRQREGSVSSQILEGLIAYAHRQASIMRNLASSGRSQWAKATAPLTSMQDAAPIQPSSSDARTRDDGSASNTQRPSHSSANSGNAAPNGGHSRIPSTQRRRHHRRVAPANEGGNSNDNNSDNDFDSDNDDSSDSDSDDDDYCDIDNEHGSNYTAWMENVVSEL